MNDPKRLRESVGEDAAIEVQLLSAAQSQGLSAGEKRAIWLSLASELALTSLPIAGAGSETSAALSGAAKAGVAKAGSSVASAFGFGKALIATAVALTLGASGYAWHRSSAPETKPRESAQARAALPSMPSARALPVKESTADVPNVATEAANPPDAESAAALAPAGASGEVRRPAPNARSGSLSAAAQSSLLREESLLILAARQALRSGDFASTLQRLEEVRARFPRGALLQEREALTVEALGRSGARAAAERRARVFLRSYPNSPYAADVERYANP